MILTLKIQARGGGHEFLIYKNPLEETQAMLRLYTQKYALYPILYFYGFGNGIVFKALLQNPNHQKIIVFEKEIQLLYSIFHYVDFSKELASKRLVILSDILNQASFFEICNSPSCFIFAKIYFLQALSQYYLNDEQGLLAVNQGLVEGFKSAITSKGNDALDVMQGLSQFVQNIPALLYNHTYKSLEAQSLKNEQTAIIVSSGPSLSKQLSLLKSYQNKACIFVADSAYSMLAQQGIKPDFVSMLERTDFTAEFFNNDFKEFDHNIIFILKALIHPNAIKYLQKNKRKFMLVCPNDDAFIKNLRLDDFGYLSMGQNVAHMNFCLACVLGFKNIIFIGQDLAFDEKGNSHPKEYKHKADYESAMYAKIPTLAYGGQKQVQSHLVWLMFKSLFEKDFLIAKEHFHVNIYNATEGGARIENCLELPFKNCCENLLKQELSKPCFKLHLLSPKRQDELLLKSYAKIINNIKLLTQTLQNIKLKQESFEKEAQASLKAFDEQALIHLITQMQNCKNEIQSSNTKGELSILNPTLIQFELNFAQLFVLMPQNKQQVLEKYTLCIQSHLELFRLITTHLKIQAQGLKQALLPLENELLKKGFEKYLKKLSKTLLC
ncbi:MULTISPECIES: motility associated factor glycosyltransferase family protein [unclassified Campylobacter]|uniref:motility associated factor glycosyltransferase family protein n=1 Tax=unclassified Campylobacter TaxID=2593542 RepID=UPI00115DAB92|nr:MULTISPECIES: motility associated factor glycosyltransferase family protein [unclassified Campylobacter]NDJ26724.1 motility associated factor glycosyltransferase family protein [Campylobacter sp. MIT 19-121]